MLNLLINSLMKKQLFLVVVAALAMASCSKDESTGINNGNAIDFRAAMQTRASETTTANITNFFVTALDKNNANYFSDAEVAVNTKWEPGQKYVYTLDFSNGAGKVDPEKPMPGPTDPFKPGEDVLGSAIKFTVTVTPWTSASENVPM